MNVNVVVFRRWKDTGSVIALFPATPSDVHGHFCEAYEHVGQHGGADYHAVIAQTISATSDECASLLRELMHIGYTVKPIKRASSFH
ncbi:MAG TPA: hypothetical protein VFE62_15805, partial [Gemmataceae bacterium]|nr:hypothetical protein [Gemmataceae bacterium]